MTWLSTRYETPTSDEPVPVLINLDHVRSIRRTAGGKVRVNWANRVEPMILAENWDEFIKGTWTR